LPEGGFAPSGVSILDWSPSERGKVSRRFILGRLVAIALCMVGAIWVSSRVSPVLTTDSSFTTPPRHTSGFRVGNEHLYRMQTLFRSTLEANRRSFPGRLGEVKGFGAGESYPQVWLRDSATLIPVTRFYYPADYLTSWLEEHLSHQQSDGQLYDWIAAGPPSHFASHAPKTKEILGWGESVLSADKNDVQADQESSAVIAAHDVFQTTGDRAWLRKEIEGVRLIDRLASGLDYLARERIDPESGLIVSGFSADWGDVSPIYPDARAIYLDEATPRVVGLYTNCQFFSASQKLAEMFGALGETSPADSWRHRATQVRESINKYLWQEDKGYYRMHLVVTPALTAGWWDDANVFAMGGNALAVLYRIADDAQARSIFDRAEERRAELGLSTVSGSLLPAYPLDFFAHPLMRDAYSYQNGGQWDWFGGRFVLSEFERGFSERARRHLVQIARKVAGNGGLHEWQALDGRGRGSRNYAGSAGALGAASFQGLFGVYLSAGSLQLKVRLGELPGEIQLFQPATDTFVRYRYRYDAARSQLSMLFESNAGAEGSLSVLLPRGKTADRIWIDEEERFFSTENHGEDRYLELSTDWGSHLLRAQLN